MSFINGFHFYMPPFNNYLKLSIIYRSVIVLLYYRIDGRSFIFLFQLYLSGQVFHLQIHGHQ